MKAPDVTVIDFETRPIMPRPDYPPEPVGFSIIPPGETKSRYFGWGHPTKNNCTKVDAQRVLKQAWKSGPLLFYNSKFDVDVAEAHMGVKPITDATLMHDAMFLMFLSEPHAMSLALKPSAERLLNMPPAEMDAVARWLIQHQNELKRDGLLPASEPRVTQSNFGKWICLAPGDIVGRYADGDVVRTLRLFKKLYPDIVARGMLASYQREQKLMPILLTNEREGICVNHRLLAKETKLYTGELEKADNWLRKRLKAPDLNVDSDEQLADALDRCGIITEWTMTAPSKTHPEGQRSTSKKNMKAEHFTDKRVSSVLMYRGKLATCLGTFMRPWLLMADKTGGIIHTNWSQTRQAKGANDTKGARTGRVQSSPNFQNIPTNLEDKNDGYMHPKFLHLIELPLMRRFILPDGGNHWFGRRDYNQQELRILAHFEDGALLQAYNDDPNLDTHGFVKSVIEEMLQRTIARSPVKIINFGYIYGQGVPSMAERLQLPVAEIHALRRAQLAALPGLKDLSNRLKERARNNEPIYTWGGREYYCEEPKFVKKFNKVMSFEYKLLNTLIQGSAGDVTKEAIVRYHEHPKKEGRMLVTVHDEIDISAEKRRFREEMLVLKEAMESIEMDVLMVSDAEYGPNWGALKKLKENRK
jgi:DNA polymerase I-like protein with 3'-5' exonuclease and polymerase domains